MRVFCAALKVPLVEAGKGGLVLVDRGSEVRQKIVRTFLSVRLMLGDMPFVGAVRPSQRGNSTPCAPERIDKAPLQELAQMRKTSHGDSPVPSILRLLGNPSLIFATLNAIHGSRRRNASTFRFGGQLLLCEAAILRGDGQGPVALSPDDLEMPSGVLTPAFALTNWWPPGRPTVTAVARAVPGSHNQPEARLNQVGSLP